MRRQLTGKLDSKTAMDAEPKAMGDTEPKASIDTGSKANHRYRTEINNSLHLQQYLRLLLYLMKNQKLVCQQQGLTVNWILTPLRSSN